MRNLIFVCCLLALTISSLELKAQSKTKASHQFTETPKIGGRYELFHISNPDEKTGEMIITDWSAKSFLIRGSGWIGTGKITGKKGYYDWKFDDGKSGRTTFVINSDGTLSGHVNGSGIDWKYIARIKL
jgi:hypothetical protein